MNAGQKGFSTAMMSLAVLAGALGAFTVVEFNTFLAKARVAEALHVADEAKLRVNEFYLLSDRFPNTAPELETVTRSISLPAGSVRDIELETSSAGHDVALKIYLDDHAPSGADTPPCVFVAGNASDRGGRGIEWRCGASGVPAKLLPGGCLPVDL